MASLDQVDSIEQQRLRGEILTLLYRNHRAQKSHKDASFLWAVLRKIGFSVGKNDVIAALQDLRERGCLAFEEQRDDYTNQVVIERIGILPAGRDLVEGTKSDPGVLIL